MNKVQLNYVPVHEQPHDTCILPSGQCPLQFRVVLKAILLERVNSEDKTRNLTNDHGLSDYVVCLHQTVNMSTV